MEECSGCLRSAEAHQAVVNILNKMVTPPPPESIRRPLFATMFASFLSGGVFAITAGAILGFLKVKMG